MEVLLTDAGTVWTETGPQTIINVSVKTETGKKATVASGQTGYIQLITTEDSATVKRYFTVDATSAAVEYTQTPTDVGAFYTANTPSGEKAYLFNAAFEAVT